MIKCKSIWFGIIFLFSLTLSACSSNPIGDFGRIDASKASHITQASYKPVPVKDGDDFANPLIFSKLEKKFRLTTILLVDSHYNISITDRQVINGEANINGPITVNALLHSFSAQGIDDIKQRYQSLAIDMKKRENSMRDFQKLAKQVLNQNESRNYIHNEIVNAKYKLAIQARRQENIELIKNVVSHMQARLLAYRHVLNQGEIVEPNLNQSKIRTAWYRLNSQTNALNILY